MEGLIVLLDPPRDLLYEKINRRVSLMIEDGLVEEVEGLLRAGYDSQDPGMTGAGYPEIVSHLRGHLTLEDAMEEIRRSHRKYARRQITWYRHQLPRGTVVLDGAGGEDEMVEKILAEWAIAEEGEVP